MKTTQQPHADRGHAEFSPSSLKYVAACAGFHGKSGTSDAAEMGTRIHEALEVRDPSALHNEEEENIYHQCVAMEDEYLEEHISDLDKATQFNEVALRMELDGVSTWGTCDRLTIHEDGKFAILADYKTGISQIDPPHSNMQAIAYTVGVFQKFPSIEEIYFAFYVPQRASAPLAGAFLREELPDMVALLSNVIKEGQRVRPLWGGGQCPDVDDCNPTQYCRFCRYEDRCPALSGLVVDVASNLRRKNFTNINIEEVNDPAAVEELYNISKIVEAWATRLKEKAKQMAMDGVEFPNLRLRSMGAPSKVTNNKKFIEIAEEWGLPQEELIANATIPVTKTAKLVGSYATKGHKGLTASEFLDACNDAGILEKQKERFTLQ